MKIKLNFPLIGRFLAWVLVATLEATVGLPLFTLYLAITWLLPLSFETALLVILLMTLVLAALYLLPLFLTGLILVSLWQFNERLKLKSGWWFVGLFLAMLIIGWWHRTPVNLFTLIYLILAWWLVIRAKGGKLLKNSWQKLRLPFLAKS